MPHALIRDKGLGLETKTSLLAHLAKEASMGSVLIRHEDQALGSQDGLKKGDQRAHVALLIDQVRRDDEIVDFRWRLPPVEE
jgi:hypothetical protein